MTNINRLTQAEEFRDDMQVPVYDPVNRQPRKISGRQWRDVLEVGVQQAAADGIAAVQAASEEAAAGALAPFTAQVAIATQAAEGAAEDSASASASQAAASASASAAALSEAGAAAIVLGNFLQVGVGAAPRTFLAKARERITPEDFGAVGDGVTDDTTNFQKALDSGALEVRLTQGKTYLVNGGLIASTAGLKLFARGATIKLKASAANKGMLRLTAAGIEVFGGTWDGNKANGNTPASVNDSWNISIEADRCSVIGARSINTHGIMVTGGSVSDTLIQNNQIQNTTGYGIFLATNVDAFRNRAIGNIIDMSEGGTFGQGILFTRSGTAFQYDWELSGNVVTGSQDAGMGTQGINLGVRGHRGRVIGNRTRYGAMGFSEGGDYTIIQGNSFTELVGTTKYGIEISGAYVVVSGNHIQGALRGVTGSAPSMDHTAITGNTFFGCSRSIDIEATVAGTARYLSITGNNIVQSGTDPAIYLHRDCKFTHISGNNVSGPGSGGAGRAVYLDTVGASVSITGNRFNGWQRVVGVFDAAATAYTNLTFSNNDVSNDNGLASTGWLTPEGSATIGAACVQLCNVESTGLVREFIDTANNVVRRYGAGTPEGAITAGVGSTFHRNNGGAATSFYIKETGTGNTGWVGK